MRRGVVIAVALVAVQGALLGGYLAVESARAPEAPFRWERLDEPAPDVLGLSWGGPTLGVRGADRVVVHFWATWCAPCRDELPALLEAAAAEHVRLVAATDEPWPLVERYFGGRVPEAVVADPGGAGRAAFGVSGLPDTFVVEGGRTTARVGGPRDWTRAAARRFLRGEEP